MPCQIINIKTNLDEKNFVYAGRGSIFGNPFEIGRDGDRAEVIKKYGQWFQFLIKDERFVKELAKLKNRNLGCYCVPAPCHCQVIKDYVDTLPEIVQDKFRLGVCGSRGWRDEKTIYRVLDKNIDRIEIIVSGGCPDSPDEIADKWCRERGVPILNFYSKWKDKEGNFDKGAGFRRNRFIVEASDKIVAFQINKSKGTQNTIEWAIKLGKPIKVFENEV